MSLQIGSPPKRFQSTWDTTQAGSSNNQVVLPLVSSNSDYDFRIDWGDGTSNRDTITAYNQAEVTHTYDSTGVYEIRIIGGITGWQFINGGDDDKITEISKWGPLTLNSLNRVFQGCSNLELTTTDVFTLPTTADQLFSHCLNLSANSAHINNWDTSSCTNMSHMFYDATGFNQSVGNWDTSNVTSMYRMFHAVNKSMAFNQDIGNWDVSQNISFFECFGVWNGTHAFNNGGSPSISGWDTSNVTSMYRVFLNGNFNQPIGTWDTSKATNMYEMFRGANDFNQDISNWDVTGVTTMYGMFSSADNFNNGGSTGINNWRPSSCTDMMSMFRSTSFNQPIGDWDVSSVTTMSNMFYDCTGFNNGGSSNISGWDTSSVTNMYRIFHAVNKSHAFNQDIGNWDVSQNTNLRESLGVWGGTHAFNNGGSSSISGWDTSNVTTMYRVFINAKFFNQPIGTWNTSKVTDMYEMFRSATGFNQDISSWNVTGVTTMYGMFSQAISFNQPIGNWTTSSLTNIKSMLYNADAFDQDLSNWNVSNVTDAGTFMINANGLSTTNYDRTLSGWSSQSVNNGINIHFGGSQYSTATGAAYRATLVSKGWTITDGGAV